MMTCEIGMPEVVIYCLTGQEPGSNGSGAGENRRAFLTEWDTTQAPVVANLVMFPRAADGYPALVPGFPTVAVPIYNVPRATGISPGCWTSN